MGATIGLQMGLGSAQEDSNKRKKPSVPIQNVPGMDQSTAQGIQDQQLNRPFNGNAALALPSPMTSPNGTPAPLRPSPGTPPPIGTSSVPPTTPDMAREAIAAQKPLIDAELANQASDTALKQQSLTGAKYELQRKMGQRFQHRISGGIGKTTMSAADQAKASGAPAGPIMGGNRIQAGQAVVATPGLDAGRLRKPVSSVNRFGSPVASASNPFAVDAAVSQMSRGTPSSGTLMRPPLRPKKVVQSAIVNPKVNPLFKPVVA